jgi:hypothetical protein
MFNQEDLKYLYIEVGNSKRNVKQQITLTELLALLSEAKKPTPASAPRPEPGTLASK